MTYIQKVNTFLIFFIIIFQAPIISGFDLNDIRKNLIIFVGCGTFALFTALKKLEFIDYYILIPIGYILAQSLIFWVEGYTIYKIAFIVGVAGFIILVSKANPLFICKALILIIPIQMVLTYFRLMPWDYEGNRHLMAWGSVRHAIRYSTLIFGAMAAGLYVINNSNNILWKRLALVFITAGVATIFDAYSNMILLMLLVAVILICISVRRFYVATLIFLTSVILFFIISPDGFSLDSERITLWKKVWSHISNSTISLIFGNGVGFWALLHKAHPHNELLNIILEFGFVGIFLIIGVFCVFLITALSDVALLIGFGGISLSFLTNSARYPDMAFIWAIFAGLILNKIGSCCDNNKSINICN